MTPDEAARAARRRDWPVRVFRPGEEPGDDLSPVSTAEERLSMVWMLTARLWELTGQPLPRYSRGEMPGRVIRPA